MPADIPHSIPCVRCAYDLRGLSPDGPCPECGNPIALTLPPCPRCARSDGAPVALQLLDSDAIGSWSCARCGGIAFERNRLRAAAPQLERSRSTATPTAFDLVAQSQVACTRCRADMQSIVIDTHTLIDRCNACGFIWLDAGELPALTTFLRRHLGDAAPPRQLEEMLTNPRQIRDAVEAKSLNRETLHDTLDWIALILAFFRLW